MDSRRLLRYRLSALALVAACSFTAAAAATAPPSLYLEDLTWPELREAQQQGRTTVIIPIGGTEQNGPQMALGKHNARVKVLAGKIATTLGTAVVAPVLAYVPEPAGHLRFPGTITAPNDAFVALLAAAANSFRRGGFTDVVFIGDSGDYQSLLQDLATRLNREWKGSPVRAHYIAAYYRGAMAAYRQALSAKGLTEAQIGVHAGVADTALLMATVPSMVHPERFADAARNSPSNGVTGDPQPSTAALGQIGVDLIVQQSSAAIRSAIAAPR